MLQRRMIALWETLHPLVGVDSYGMDLVYLQQSDEIRFLELSPFLRCTGAHCFRWGNDVDADVLEGRRPFEFRLVEQTAPHFASMFTTGWDDRWDAAADPAPFWSHYQTPTRRRALGLRRGVAQLSRRVSTRAWAIAATTIAAVALGPAPTPDPSVRAVCLVAAGCAAAVLACSATALGPPTNVGEAPCTHALFVYGTLKRGMQWNSKFLASGARYVGEVRTVDHFPLVVGRCGVPYLLHDMKGDGHRVFGELYMVNDDTLQGLDDYEGVGKCYYKRPLIEVIDAGSGLTTTASVYCMLESPTAFKTMTPLEMYSLSLHLQCYRATEHIQLKQQLYLMGKDQYTRRGVPHPAVSIDIDAGLPRDHESE
jgi:gamma-glutamylaminecyclotransferase